MVTLTKSMYPPVEKIDKIAAGYLITPKIPHGLAAAVEGLTREVIRHHPEDIYVFAAQHFEKLLQLREQYSRSVDQQWNVSQDQSHFFSLKDYYKEASDALSHQMSHHESKTTSRYAKYSKQQKSEEYIKHKRKKAYGRDVKSRSPKVISGLMATNKDIKNKLKKHRISTQQSRNGAVKRDKVALKKLDSVEKVKGYVVDKFAQTSSLEELQSVNYTEAVQNIIDNNTPVINRKIEELKTSKLGNQLSKESQNNSSVLESRLNETHNLLKDISSCFPKLSLQSRPRSADAAHNYVNYCNTSDKLEAMLNETHHLLLGISKNFFQPEGELQKSKSEDYDHHNSIYLPSVQSTSASISSPHAQKIAVKNGSFALPPVTISSSSSSSSPIEQPKSAKGKREVTTGGSKHDLTLPILSSGSEINVESKKSDEDGVNRKEDEQEVESNCETPMSDRKASAEVNVTSDDGVETLNVSDLREKSPEQLCYMLTSADSPIFRIPYNVTTVIIPDRSNTDDPCLSDPFASLIGEVVSAALTPEEIKELQPAFNLSSVINKDNLSFHKQNLQCINEEDASEDYKEDDKIILEEIIDEEDQKMFIRETVRIGEEIEDDKEENVEQKEIFMEKVIIDDDKIIKSDDANLEKDDDVTEPSSTTKETSPTDGPLESPVIYEKEETGPTISKSTDCIESSNEAKETTLTDGVSLLSLDDPVRPYVPELNLDSLQDITVSSFKLTEDECDYQGYDEIDRTNSNIETPTLNLNDSGDSEEIGVGDADADVGEKTYIVGEDVTVEKLLSSSEDILNHEDACEIVKLQSEKSSETPTSAVKSGKSYSSEKDEAVDVEFCGTVERVIEVREIIEEVVEIIERVEKEVAYEKGIEEIGYPNENGKILNQEAQELDIEDMEAEDQQQNDLETSVEDEKVVERSETEEIKNEEEKEKDGVVAEKEQDDERMDSKNSETEKLETIESEKTNVIIIPASSEIHPSIEDTIVLETLLSSQESLESQQQMEIAVVKIQAGFRGFLQRRHMQKNASQKKSDDNSKSSENLQAGLESTAEQESMKLDEETVKESAKSESIVELKFESHEKTEENNQSSESIDRIVAEPSEPSTEMCRQIQETDLSEIASEEKIEAPIASEEESKKSEEHDDNITLVKLNENNESLESDGLHDDVNAIKIEESLIDSSKEVLEDKEEEVEQGYMLKRQDYAAKTIQNNFRSYQTRKRLFRENAMQKTTTISREKLKSESEDSNDKKLQHTGEFHDCIVLPLSDNSTSIESVRELQSSIKN